MGSGRGEAPGLWYGTSFGPDCLEEKTEGLSLGPNPDLSSSRDSKRPKFLPGTQTPACDTMACTSEPCLTPQLLAPPTLHPFLLDSRAPRGFLLSWFCPLSFRALFLFSLLPRPRAPRPAPPLPRAGVEECVFCFSPVPAPSPSGDQERAELAAGRRHLEARQALYAELQTQLDNCPESVREQLQEQLRRVSFTSPLPRPREPPARKRGAVGRDRLGPAVPAGRQGRCWGLEGTGKDRGGWRFPFVRLQAVPPGWGQSRAEERGRVGGRSLPPFSPGPAPELTPLCPGLPGSEWYCEYHPTAFVTVIQGGRGPGD